MNRLSFRSNERNQVTQVFDIQALNSGTTVDGSVCRSSARSKHSEMQKAAGGSFRRNGKPHNRCGEACKPQQHRCPRGYASSEAGLPARTVPGEASQGTHQHQRSISGTVTTGAGRSVRDGPLRLAEPDRRMTSLGRGMNKKALSESDSCDKCIWPAMEQDGWDGMVQIYCAFALRAGRVVVRGRRAKRDVYTVLRADYALFFKPNIPLAVVEAKDNNHALCAGIAQAINYDGQKWRGGFELLRMRTVKSP